MKFSFSAEGGSAFGGKALSKKGGRKMHREYPKNDELSRAEFDRANDMFSAKLAMEDPALMEKLQRMRDNPPPPRTASAVEHFGLMQIAFPFGGFPDTIHAEWSQRKRRQRTA